ncbi:hypothetical protein [Rhodococcus sp. T2V]|uniref:hypothetical protein n=1 Tax=Rhodococcus sp. T2V TaxID=3034164 RepID=UPI0023E11461|nr:hypothetical protein [Rhodococcus sp. T2V]
MQAGDESGGQGEGTDEGCGGVAGDFGTGDLGTGPVAGGVDEDAGLGVGGDPRW